MEKTIKELEKQLAALEKSEEKLGKLIDNPLERTVLETKQEVNNFFRKLSDLSATGYRQAIYDYAATLGKKGNENEKKAKKEKMEQVRNKILKLEEEFLSREKELLNIDKGFKKII